MFKYDTSSSTECIPIFLASFPREFLHTALELKTKEENKMKNNTLATCISRFSRKLRERSKKTNSCYTCDVKNIFKYITDNFFNTHDFSEVKLEEIENLHIKKAIDWLFSETKYSARTLTRKKYAWNSFCKYINKNEWLITRKINKKSSFNKDIIDTNHVLKMIKLCEETAKNTSNPYKKIIWLKRIVALNIGFNEGLRVSEYKNVQFNDVLQKEIIEIRSSKHDGWRTIPVTDFTKKAVKNLKNFLKLHNKLPQNGNVFENKQGNILSTRTFQRWIRQIATMSKIPMHIAKTHGLRHRFAKNFLKKHKEISILSEILGHTSIETTRVYTKLTQTEVKNLLQSSCKESRKN